MFPFQVADDGPGSAPDTLLLDWQGTRRSHGVVRIVRGRGGSGDQRSLATPAFQAR